MDRRAFLKRTGAVALAGMLPRWAAAAPDAPKANAVNAAVTDFDVIVVGGGPSGCTAAIAAAREGSKVLLIEATGALGGLGTSGMVPAWCPFTDGEKVVYRGLAKHIFDLAKKGVPHEPADKYDWVTINPEYLMGVYDREVLASGAKVLFFSRVAGVEMAADGVVDAIIVANKGGLTPYKAKVYVDASGDGDVCAWAGAKFLKGDSDGVLQKSTLCYSVANVNTRAYLEGPELHSGHNPDSASARAFKTGRFPLLDKHCCHNLVGPGVVQFNANHLVVKDTTDPEQLSDAMLLGRRTAEQHLEMLKEFRPDAFADAFIVKTAIIPGIRDSRRIVGDYTFTADDWHARRSFDDEIGRNCYFIDVHKSGHPEIHYGRGESHGIPYRCMLPAGIENVLTAGRCVSTDDEAYGSLRVMPPCLVTGEAAGVAAHLSALTARHAVHAVDADELRRRLRSHGQYFL